MNLRARLALCWRILRARPGNLLAHAERELPRSDGDDMQGRMNSQLKELVLVFSTHGHSGFSAGYATSVLEKLLRYEPIGPLSGEDDEWCDVSEYSGRTVWQNKRCSRVFKDEDGAYDIDGKVFVDPDGCSYTNRDSRVPVTFPYTPKTKYVSVPEGRAV